MELALKIALGIALYKLIRETVSIIFRYILYKYFNE